MKKITNSTLTIVLIFGLVMTMLPIFITQSHVSADTSNQWNLINDARPLKGYSGLRETVWQKNASLSPNGPYDQIGLHRLVSIGIVPKGVVFINPGTYLSGAALTSNPITDSFTLMENESQAVYWANRGFDVYTIDYRTHFVPATLNNSQLGFMANWGWAQWISDIKEAVNMAKATSGVTRIFMAGQSFGGRATMNYATVYPQDIRGIILLDGGNASANTNPSNSYNLTAALSQENAAAGWALITPNLPGRTPVAPTFQGLMKYALANPAAPAQYPPGTSLTPPISPLTNQSWSNITEWCSYILSGATSNILGGYMNVSTVTRAYAGMDRYWPDRLNLEFNAYQDWNNCPYVTNDFDDNYKAINVPLIGFTSELYGLDRFGPIGNIANPDVTRTTLKGYGHMDVFMGTYSARDVSEPTYQWLLSHTLTAYPSVTSAISQTGQAIGFSASASGGPTPYTYQWYKGTTILPGQTASYLIASENTAGTYTYFCSVTDAMAMSANTTAITLTVSSPTPTSAPTTISTSKPAPTPTPVPVEILSPTITPTTSPGSTTTATPSTTASPANLTVSETFAIVAVIAILAIIAAGIVVISRKRKNQTK